MKKALLSFSAIAIGLSVFAAPPVKIQKGKDESIKINNEESTLKWHAKKVTGEHFGFVKFESGEVLVNGTQLTGGIFNVNMTTIESTDLQGEYKGKLEGHLKSDDFFSTQKFATAVLKIKSATFIAVAKPGEDNYNIVADLTIKGITTEINFPAMVIVAKGKVIANADFNIDRTKYDIKYGSKTFFEEIGNKAIDNEFNIKVRIVADKGNS